MRSFVALLFAALVLVACGRRGSLPPASPWPDPHPALRSSNVRVDAMGAQVRIAAVPNRDADSELLCSTTVPDYPWAQVPFATCARLTAGAPATTVTLPSTITALRLRRDQELGPTVILDPTWRAAAYSVDVTTVPESWLYFRDTTSATAVPPLDGRYRRLVRDLAGLRVYGPLEPTAPTETAP